MEKQRVLWLDVLKGIAIILVIIGHGPVIDERIYNFIWAFHMPLFFCIAGYTFHKSDNDTEFIRKKIKRLLKPYGFTVIMLTILGGYTYVRTNGMDIIGTIKIIGRWIYGGLYGSCWSYEEPFVIYDIGAIWFLCALFCAELLFHELLKLDKNLMPLFVLILAYVGIATRTYIWLPWGIQCGMTTLVFLYAGYLARENDWIDKRISFIMHSVMLSVCVICIWKNSMAIVGNNTYTLGCLTIIGALCISFYLARFCKLFLNTSNRVTRIFSFFGKNSMTILCFHLVELDFFPWTAYVNFFSSEELNYLLILIFKLIYAAVVVTIVRRINFLKRIFE